LGEEWFLKESLGLLLEAERVDTEKVKPRDTIYDGCARICSLVSFSPVHYPKPISLILQRNDQKTI
jgi:hypothetical protein